MKQQQQGALSAFDYALYATVVITWGAAWLPLRLQLGVVSPEVSAVWRFLLGGLIAAGMGSFSMALVTAWLALPPQAIPAGGAAGSAAYLVGVFGPAFIELVLDRLRGAKGGADDE